MAIGNQRIGFLEGLRGVAAMQVVLLHSVSAFLPGEGWWSAPPLRLLYDGQSAVWLFFLISGAVLTLSFERDAPALLAPAAKRLVRLWLPVAAAAIVALILLALFPQAHVRAAALTGSAWLAMDESGAATPVHLLREISLDSLLLGYRESTLFAPFAGALPPMETSLDAPFWSLHIELYGSFLVLALVAVRHRSRRLHAAAIAAAAILCASHPLFLFVLGHLCARALRPHAAFLPGAALLTGGLVLCAEKDWRWVEPLRTGLAHVTLFAAPNAYQFASQLAAILIFLGVLFCEPARRALAAAPLRGLGRLSFSLYLLHFPILFTLTSALVVALAGLPAAAAIAAGAGLIITFAAAIPFERWIDRPATALSRRVR